MNKLIAFTFFFWYVGSVNSQHTFYKELETTKSLYATSLYENNDEYVVIGLEYDKDDYFSERGIIYFLNKKGEITNLISNDNKKYIRFLKKIEKNGKNLILGTYRDTVSQIYKKGIWEYDSIYELKNFYPIKDSNVLWGDNFIGDYILFENNFLLTTSGTKKQSLTGDTITTDGMLIFLDYVGNVIWEKYYNYDFPLSEDICKNLMNFGDGLVFNLSTYSPFLPISIHHTLVTDLLGNELWRKRIDNYKPINLQLPSEQSALNLIKNVPLENGNLLCVSELYRDYTNLSNKDIIFIEFDSLGNENNAKIIPLNRDFYLYNAVLNEKNELILSGSYTFNDSSLFNQFIAKFDLNLDLMWLKEYGTSDSSETNYCNLLTSDGGFLLGGSRFRYFPTAGNTIVLVKTDCMGNLVWDNKSCLLPTENEMIIFPNPTTENLIIQCSSFESNINTEMKIFNDLGQIIYKDFELTQPIFSFNTSHLANGIYYCELIQNGKSIKGKFVKI